MIAVAWAAPVVGAEPDGSGLVAPGVALAVRAAPWSTVVEATVAAGACVVVAPAVAAAPGLVARAALSAMAAAGVGVSSDGAAVGDAWAAPGINSVVEFAATPVAPSSPPAVGVPAMASAPPAPAAAPAFARLVAPATGVERSWSAPLDAVALTGDGAPGSLGSTGPGALGRSPARGAEEAVEDTSTPDELDPALDPLDPPRGG